MSEVLLVSPTPGYKSSYEKKARPHPSISSWRLKNWIEKRSDNNVKIVNSILLEPYDVIKNEINKFDFLGITSYYVTAPYDAGLGRLAKQINPDIKVVYGGVNPTFNPDFYFNYGKADFVVNGDGEKDFQKILNRKKPLDESLTEKEWQESVLMVKYGETDLRKCWKETERKFPEAEAIKSVRIVSEDYCPRGCRFCSSTNFFSGKPRMLSAQQLHQKIIECEELGSKRVLLQGDSFLLGRGMKRLKRLSEMELGSKIDCELMVQLDIRDLFRDTEKKIKRLKKSGVVKISTGIESFSNEILKDLGKRGSEEKKIEKTLKKINNMDIEIFGNIILSSPKAKVKDIIHTARRLRYWMDEGISFGVNVPLLYFEGSQLSKDNSGCLESEEVSIPFSDIAFKRPMKIWPENEEARNFLKFVWDKVERLDFSSKELSKEIVKTIEEGTEKYG